MDNEISEAELTREKIHAELARLMAETAKLNAGVRWYPVVAAAGIFAAAFVVLELVCW